MAQKDTSISPSNRGAIRPTRALGRILCCRPAEDSGHPAEFSVQSVVKDSNVQLGRSCSDLSGSPHLYFAVDQHFSPGTWSHGTLVNDHVERATYEFFRITVTLPVPFCFDSSLVRRSSFFENRGKLWNPVRLFHAECALEATVGGFRVRFGTLDGRAMSLSIDGSVVFLLIDLWGPPSCLGFQSFLC